MLQRLASVIAPEQTGSCLLLRLLFQQPDSQNIVLLSSTINPPYYAEACHTHCMEYSVYRLDTLMLTRSGYRNASPPAKWQAIRKIRAV
jgi:hypothetical protein